MSGIVDTAGAPPAVHQVLATLGYGDAIGHEVLGIQRVLRAAGFASDIFVETADPRLEEHTRDYWELADLLRPQDVLIHHFSIGSSASRLAYALPGKMVLIYHNITPPEFFIDVHPMLVHQCFFGRRELTAYRERCALALGDSEFNRQELQATGFQRTAVLPVIPSFAHLDVTPNHLVAGAFDDAWVNIVFVGRIIPNKGIGDLVRFFHAYKTRYNARSRLIVVGSHAGFERYFAMVQGLIAQLGTPDVYFTGQVSNEELTALYDIADLFLGASEHEGFCVPLIEAFYKGVPVLAYAATAVPGTMDGAGVLYDEKNPARVAALIDAIVSDRGISNAIIEAQDAALQRLLKKDFAGTLLGYVRQVIAMPPQQAPRVATDFWEQFEMSAQLGEIRKYRPSAYRALPKRPTLEPEPVAEPAAATAQAGLKPDA
jgi:glycosyltransferase involved in cell wall biosynthesis